MHFHHTLSNHNVIIPDIWWAAIFKVPFGPILSTTSLWFSMNYCLHKLKFRVHVCWQFRQSGALHRMIYWFNPADMQLHKLYALDFQRPLCPYPSDAERSSVASHLYSFPVPKARQADDSANLSKHKPKLLVGEFSLFPSHNQKVYKLSLCGCMTLNARPYIYSRSY